MALHGLIISHNLLKNLKEDRKGDRDAVSSCLLSVLFPPLVSACPCPLYQAKWYAPYQFLLMTRVIRPGGIGMGSGLFQVLSDQRILGTEDLLKPLASANEQGFYIHCPTSQQSY